jgi:hypothetical protein
MNTDLMQYMAELPAIFNALEELGEQSTFQLPQTTSFDFGPNAESYTSLVETPPSLDFSTDSYEDMDFVEDIRPIKTSYPINSTRYTSPYEPARTALLYKVYDLKDALRSLGDHMNAKLANGITISKTQAREKGSPIQTTYHFNNWRDMTAYNCYWSVVILTNKVLMRLLPPFDQARYELQAECRSVAIEICKTWEDAWASRPIGAFHTGLSFVVAYEFCTPEIQTWIVNGLNSLLDYHQIDAFRWSDEVIVNMAEKLAGEGPSVAFPNVRVEGDVR